MFFFSKSSRSPKLPNASSRSCFHFLAFPISKHIHIINIKFIFTPFSTTSKKRRNASAMSYRHCQNDEVEIYLKKLSSSTGFERKWREREVEKKRFISVTAHQLTSSPSFPFSPEWWRSGNKWKGKIKITDNDTNFSRFPFHSGGNQQLFWEKMMKVFRFSLGNADGCVWRKTAESLWLGRKKRDLRII